MEEPVRQELIKQTADFYRFHARSFEETRQNGWTSWSRVLTEIRKSVLIQRVLDLGCGNGRFAGFLDQAVMPNLSYTGVDTETHFIDKAKPRYPQMRFIVGSIEETLTSAHDFDLVVCFGVLHHVPGHDARAAVLAGLPNVLRPGGVAAISLWQPTLLKNFASKAQARPRADLEGSDYLLGWNGDFSHLRYCHNFDDEEIGKLIAQAPMELLAQFQGAGNDISNRYVLLQRPE